MRVLICGDRNWKDFEMILKTLAALQPEVVIEGECRGADIMGRMAAKQLQIPVMSFPADWATYGLAAGPIRNQKMLDEGRPDLVLAFHDDIAHSRGTSDMVRRAKRAGIKVIVYKHSQEGKHESENKS